MFRLYTVLTLTAILRDEMVITVIATCFKDSEGHSMITSDEAVAKTVLRRLR